MSEQLGFTYHDDTLCCDGVRLEDVVASCGTPTYAYSARAMLAQLHALQAALAPVPHRICYAVKTNSNLAILATLARAGVGFDIVSGGELARLQHIGAPMERVVFAGVGKTAAEMHAALAAGIGMFNVESLPEAEQLSACARTVGCTATVALRVNPEIEAGAHHYIATGTGREKFGVPLAAARDTYRALAALPGLVPRGLHVHIGSQILDVSAFARTAAHVAALTRELRGAGLPVHTINLGGGLGIRYRDEASPPATVFAAAILPEVTPLGVELIVEPGRFLVGNAGVLLARVLYLKQSETKRFVVLDAGMNDLMRPSLYGAHHEILPLHRHPARAWQHADVVGPLCEAGDFLARHRRLPGLEQGESVAICSAGAYGFTMSSNYNSRPRAAEVLLRDGAYRIVRARETYADLLHGETDWPPEEGAR
jgi:diaminopimelate decarboxylase